MEELVRIKAVCRTEEILLVADAMTGQEAVNVANVSTNGSVSHRFVLTKLDGECQGGAALSIKGLQESPSNLSAWRKA
jgi:signal recognition particle subunit SRP54